MKNKEIPEISFLKDSFKAHEVINFLDINDYMFTTLHNKLNDHESDYSKEIPCLLIEEILIDDDKDFTYKINEKGFRSKSFKNFNKDNINILFAGCSVTFGTGLPEECTWYKKLHDKISNEFKDKEVDFYNLSINGSSIHLIIRNIITFFNTVGKPDYLFLFLPEISRSLIYDGQKYINQNWDIKPQLMPDENFYENFIKNFCFEDNLLINSTMFSLIELLCNSSDVKFVWSSWHNTSNNINKKIKYNNFLNINYDLEEYWLAPQDIYKKLFADSNRSDESYNIMLKSLNKSNKKNEPYWVCARDGVHFGTKFHVMVADAFFKVVKEKYGK